ncbi:ABC-type glycerol-3-phosphate transport system, substrate-binding protein [Cohnella sp. OV330]|uniref:ABC transporter substrate-binding protein n=1 Tax=Cohnella sp. OV330 TaxID=1855288 RepID=UPI0008EE68C1|nr:extracellular solute-binding protein [Cohnella sp. OV330]SFB46894.1 ABC-type glycerol-3-phosphate transport system, substrate-binding protein [Cohnella sp. OV330]
MKDDRDRWERTLSDLPLGSGGFGTPTIKKVKERIKMLERRARRRRRAAAASVVALLIAGAVVFRGELTELFTHEEAAKPVISDAETTTLNIMYWDNGGFMSLYGQPFIIRHPSVRFEYSEYPGKSANLLNLTPGIDTFKAQLQKSQADLVQVPLAYLPELSAAGLLKPLDTWMKRDNVSDDSWQTAVKNTVREAGGGGLYGFAPEFTGFALYYNRKLFRENGVPEPTDGMTWAEVMNLAARFEGLKKNEKPVYGVSFGYNSAIWFEANLIGSSQGLRLADAKLKEATVDTPAWTTLWTKLAAGHREGWISNEPALKWEGSVEMKELYAHDPFLNGRSAMTYASSSYLNNISQAGSAMGLGEQDWGVLSPPTDEGARGTDGAFEVPFVFAIPEKSPHADAAWELLKYIMSPSQANRLVRFPHGDSLPTVAADAAADDARSSVFYRAAVDPSRALDAAARNSDPAYKSVAGVVWTEANDRTQNLDDGELDVPALLKALQAKAEQAIRAASAGGQAKTEATP